MSFDIALETQKKRKIKRKKKEERANACKIYIRIDHLRTREEASTVQTDRYVQQQRTFSTSSFFEI